MVMIVEESVEQKFAKETEILRENLPMGSHPDRHSGKPATNHLSYDTAHGALVSNFVVGGEERLYCNCVMQNCSYFSLHSLIFKK
jgi:hypothetical protein